MTEPRLPASPLTLPDLRTAVYRPVFPELPSRSRCVPGLHVVQIIRRDGMSQAISWAKAGQGGVWVTTDDPPLDRAFVPHRSTYPYAGEARQRHPRPPMASGAVLDEGRTSLKCPAEVPLAWGLERQRPMARRRGERRHACECERSGPHRGAVRARLDPGRAGTMWDVLRGNRTTKRGVSQA